jgi:hypothetical protein
VDGSQPPGHADLWTLSGDKPILDGKLEGGDVCPGRWLKNCATAKASAVVSKQVVLFRLALSMVGCCDVPKRLSGR